jgi:hypothetical protein
MDKINANQILDKHKETGEFGYVDITRALRVTGDIENNGSSGVGGKIPQESERPWENPSIGMVVTGLLGHRKTAWISRRR